MNHPASTHRAVVVLLVLGTLGPSVHASGAATGERSEVPETVRVASAIADLAGVCSGRLELAYVIDGITGRWSISWTSAGPDWVAARRAGSPTAMPHAQMGDLLRALADADSSGAVSSLEVGQLQKLMVFGFIQEHYRGPMGYDLEGLMVATGLDPASLAATQSEHSVLVARAAERGLRWPWGR